MLGLGSFTIALAFWLSLGASLLCIVYGLANWNKKGAPDVIDGKSDKEG